MRHPSGEGRIMMNIVRIAKVVALLAFVLPWVAVSCQGVDLATASGVELIQGKMTENPQASEQLAAGMGGMGGLNGGGAGSISDEPGMRSSDLGMNYFALATAVVIVLGLVLTFVGGAKTAGRNALLSGLLAAALSYGAIWQFRETVKAESAQDQQESAASDPFAADNPFATDMSGMGGMANDMIDSMVQERFGYWIVLVALLVAAGAGGLAMAGAGKPQETPAA
jgi:hypothetical protein